MKGASAIPDTLSIQRTLRRRLDSVEIGLAATFGELTVWPLLGGGRAPDYDLLDRAIEAGSARVTELGGGRVPELLFTNDGDRPVLLVDGEELIGAKQNRSLNISILAPARAALTIPVSCMEAGRWSDEDGEQFQRSTHLMAAGLRMSRLEQVSDALADSGGIARRSDQSAVWEEIDTLHAALEAPSETSALNDAYTQYSTQLSKYVNALTPAGGACGAIFAIRNGRHGLELFDAPSTFSALNPKVIRSWALEAIAAQQRPRKAGSKVDFDPRILLDRLARRRCRAYDAVGLGADVRLRRRSSRLQGAALVVGDRVLHFAAFHSGFN